MKFWYTNSDNSVQMGEIVSLDAFVSSDSEAIDDFVRKHPNRRASHIGVQSGFWASPKLHPNPNYDPESAAQSSAKRPQMKPSARTSGDVFGQTGKIPFPVKPTSRLASFHGVIAVIGFVAGGVLILMSFDRSRYLSPGFAMLSVGFWGLVWWWILNWAAQTRWLQATELAESRKQSASLEKLTAAVPEKRVE